MKLITPWAFWNPHRFWCWTDGEAEALFCTAWVRDNFVIPDETKQVRLHAYYRRMKESVKVTYSGKVYAHVEDGSVVYVPDPIRTALGTFQGDLYVTVEYQ